ncbi:MAG: hypothetical protein HQK54_08910 [Oligoflexales bacterium]|nr:hypothetical protein [Oligoflexales bacterium]
MSRVKFTYFAIMAASILFFTVLQRDQLEFHPIIDDYLVINFEKVTKGSLWDFHNRFDFSLLTDYDRVTDATSWRLWWGDPSLKIKFFRPLSDFSFSVDEQLPGKGAYFFRLHSMVWAILYIGIIGVIFYRLLRPLHGAFSTLIIGISLPLSLHILWIASRCHLMASVFSLAAFCFYLKWHETSFNPRYKVAMLLLLILSLASSEAGYFGFLLIFFYEWIFFGGGIRNLFTKSFFILVILVIYTQLYLLGGYGAKNSGFYTSFLENPLAFFKVFPARYPILIAAQIGLDLGKSCDGAYPAKFYAAAFILISAFSCGLYFTIKDQNEKMRKLIKWLVVVNLTTLVPFVSIPPHPRVFLMSQFSIVPLSIMQIATLGELTREKSFPVRALSLAWRAYLSLIFFVLYPLTTFISTDLAEKHIIAFENVMKESEFTDLNGYDNEYFVINAGLAIFNDSYTESGYKYFHPGSRPFHWNIMTISENDMSLKLLDDRTLEITYIAGDVMDFRKSTIFRQKERQFKQGTMIHQGSMDVTILELSENGFPKKMRFHFLRPLDYPGYHFVTWKGNRFVKFEMPKAGKETVVEKPALPSDLVL